MAFLKYKNSFIIAEAGVNHNGELRKAFELVDIAIDCKADAIKFQTFKASEITTRYNKNLEYVDNDDKTSNYDIINKLSLRFEDFKKINEYCKMKGILFLSTPDGTESLNYLTDKLDVPIIKIGSTEITNIEYLNEIAKKNKPLILSTGLSSLEEVKKAFNSIKKHNKKEICVLHCTSEYPAPINEINIKAMLTIKKELNCSVGFSDHSIGNEASIAAITLGADVIEKHFTIDKSLDGPDHKASMCPGELKDFVFSIRQTEKLLGSGIKEPTKSEIKNLPGIRRGIVAAIDIKKGTTIKKNHLNFKRPFVGINPEESKGMIGKKIKIDLKTDQPILWKYFD